MKCSSANNNQAICVGGMDPELSDQYQIKDEWHGNLSVGVIDMQGLFLKSNYNASAAPYTAPGIVRRAYDNP
jgi:hypothetical protein